MYMRLLVEFQTYFFYKEIYTQKKHKKQTSE